MRELHKRVKDRTFHERDVLALLILIREHSKAGSPVREFSDFVAHREKNRGPLKEYVHHVLAFREAQLTGKAAKLAIDFVHKPADFRSSLNEVLKACSLAALKLDESNDVLTCVMSLLQDVRLLNGKKAVGRFVLARTKKELWLQGVVMFPPPQDATIVFPALAVPNRYCSLSGTGPIEEFAGLVEARCTNGRLCLYVNGKRAG